MSLQRFAIVCFAAVVGMTAAAGQVPLAPTKVSSSARASRTNLTRTPDGHPDLQGVWSFALLTPLERPDEFAGKATLTDQEAADYAKKKVERDNKDNRGGGSGADVSRAYNDAWWDFGTRASNQTSLIVDPADGKLPAMAGQGKDRSATYAAKMGRIPEGPEDRPLWERCILGFNSGPPMLPSAYNNNVQIFQTANTVALLNEMVHNARIVPLDGRPHGTSRQMVGDSRGHWEGDTLVIETVNFTNAGTGTAMLRNIPLDQNLRLTERFTRKDASTLLYQFTVDDPTVWTKPWTAVIPMVKSGNPMYEYACHEGNYGMFGILTGARADEAAVKQ